MLIVIFICNYYQKNMGKTFKYAYQGNSFRCIQRHAEQKVGNRRKERRALKDFTRLEMFEEENTHVKKLNANTKHDNLSYPGGYNSTATWNNSNTNVDWVEDKINNDGNWKGMWSNSNEFPDLILISNADRYGYNNVAYNIHRNHFDPHNDKIGKKQLSRRGEIGRMKLKQRNKSEILESEILESENLEFSD